MGSVTPPPKVLPVPVIPAPTGPDSGNPKSRLKLPEKQMPLGPSGMAILGTLVAIGVGWFAWSRMPSHVPKQALHVFLGGEALSLDWANPSTCHGKVGCLAVYLTTDEASKKAAPGALALAGEIDDLGVETFIIVGKDLPKASAKMARTLQRPVLFDPDGEWARGAKLESLPAWIAYTPSGAVRLRTTSPPSAADVTGALAP
jgi:hypothetical protein